MTLPAPNLDDKSYQDLVREAISKIPVYAPQWTDYNATDPGITLIELFAWLTEMQIYRLNRITEKHLRVFLRTLGIWVEDGKTIEAAISRARADLREVQRAVTSKDYEYLVMNTGKVSKAKAIAGYHPDIEGEPCNTVSVIIVPVADSDSAEGGLLPSKSLIDEIYKLLEGYRLLATEVFVLPAVFIEISLTATVVKKRQFLERTVKEKAISKLANFFDPIKGGSDGRGWPFGRPVYLSEVFQVLADCGEVDYVKSVDVLSANPIYAISKDAIVQGNAPEKLEIPKHGLVKPGKININVE
jgi:hypothetical protein